MEASDVFGQQRFSAASYNEFLSQLRRGYHYSISETKSDRESAKREISRLKIKIKALREETKRPLPKRPDYSIRAYLVYVENSKQKAIEENMEWIEPEDYLALKAKKVH